MTNTELIQAIKAEIERIASRAMNEEGQDLCEYLLSFLSSSEPEKPMQEGLEEEIKRTYHDGSVADTSDLDHNSYENIARYFFNLGLNAKKEEDK